MEPTEKQRLIHWVIYTTAKTVEELSGGWWVRFDGSWESLYFGGEKPFSPGDKVKITFERVE